VLYIGKITLIVKILKTTYTHMRRRMHVILKITLIVKILKTTYRE